MTTLPHLLPRRPARRLRLKRRRSLFRKVLTGVALAGLVLLALVAGCLLQ